MQIGGARNALKFNGQFLDKFMQHSFRYTMALLLGAVLMAGSASGQLVQAPLPRIGDVREYQGVDDWTNQVRLEERYEVIGSMPEFTRMRIDSKNINLKNNLMEMRLPEEETTRSDMNVDYFGKSGTTRRVNFSWPLEPGKKWTYEYTVNTAGNNGNVVTLNYRIAAEVAGWESVTTPAGTFRAMKVVHKGTMDIPASSTGAYKVGWTLWYSPDVAGQVKQTYQSDSPVGAPGARNTTVLTSYKRTN